MSKNKPRKGISRAQDIVLRNIERIPGRKQNVNGAVIMIVCPFHPDRNPSAMLNAAPTDRFPLGFFACFGCGKTAKWNELAQKLGLETIEDKDLKQDRTLDRDLEATRNTLLGVRREEIGDDAVDEDDFTPSNHGIDDLFKKFRIELPVPFPAETCWRRVPGWLLKRIGAYMAFDPQREDRVVVLPVRVEGVTVGGIKAWWKKEKRDTTSYKNLSGEWAKKEGLFPFDYALKVAKRKKVKTLVIVEGPRDALRLLRYGIPAIAVLGTQNWSKEKANLLIDTGMRIMICMDGDAAGEKARKTIKKDLKKHGNYCVYNLFKLAQELGVDKLDPGEMDKEYVMEIKASL